MQQNTTFKSYLSKIILIVALFVFLPIIFSPLATTTTSSYIASCVCFLIITLVVVKLMLRENWFVRFYAFAFIIQTLLGLAHYLYFVDLHYFQGNGGGSSAFWHEYLSVFGAIDRLQDARNNFGVLYVMGSEDFQVTHYEIWHIISYPFYFLQHKWLNYEPFNIFASLSTSCNIMLLYKNFYRVDKSTSKTILYWTAFFPSFLLADTVWRDAFGIYLISIGITLASLSDSNIAKVFSFVVFCFGSFIQRTMYIILACVSIFWGNIIRTRTIVLKLLYFILGVVALYYVGNIAQDANEDGYSNSYVNNMSLFALPIKIIFGMIGPFPWTNFFDGVRENPASAWDIKGYVMGTFQLGYLFAIFIKWKLLSFKRLDTLTIMGFGMMLSGFLTKQLHMGYISQGLLFTLPWFFSQIGPDYKVYVKYSLTILVMLNILLLSLGHLNISALWR